MNTTGNRFKKIVYDFDLVSGKVNQVSYQGGYADAFYHSYQYDAENRITNVQSSIDSVNWDNDAFYSYYKHGPLARTVLGQQQVQGLNYAYTLQGWLKAINPDPYTGGSFTLRPDSAGTVVANNAYSVLLNYFDGDYKPISNVAGPDNGVSTALGSDYAALFNGNISSMGVNIKKLNAPLLYSYQYDQLNRLTHMDAWKRTGAAWSALTASTDFQETVTYDPNGNILTYHRNRETTGSGNQMDQLQYNYTPNTNQLDHIYDTIPGASNAGDIASQSAGNYTYDSIGELVGDAASNITNIAWTVYGKIASITKSTDTVIKYTYDPAGNRISKTVVHGGDSTVTWYVRDAQGNILSVYTSGDPAVNGGALAQTELDLYGSSRLGIWRRSVPVLHLDSTVHSPFPNSGDSIIFTRGNKLFELTNHLGNVLATVSDKRYGVSPDDSTVVYYNPEVVSANDYYPFGMMQYARSWTESGAGGYRYGFNGQEKSDEIAGAGNHTTAEFWEYDTRIGRRWNLDPMNTGTSSPYSVLANNPIIFIDPFGLDTVGSRKEARNTGEIVRTRKGDSYWYERKTKNGWEEMGSSGNLPTVIVSAKRSSSVAGGFYWPNYSHQDAMRWEYERAIAFRRIGAGLPLDYKGSSEEYRNLLPRFKIEYQAEQDSRTMQYAAVGLTVGLPTLVYTGLELAPYILEEGSISRLTLKQLSDLAGSYSKPLNGTFNLVKARGLTEITAAEIEGTGVTKEMLMVYRELAAKYVEEIMSGAMKYTARGLATQSERIEILDAILKAFY